MSDYIITSIIEEPRLENGKPVGKLRIEFMVGVDGPFFERFDKEATTDYDIRARLTTFAQLLRSVRA